MTAGAEIFNPNTGSVLLNNNRANLSLAVSSYAPLQENTRYPQASPLGMKTCYITYSSLGDAAPLLAISPSSEAALMDMGRSGNDWTYTVLCSQAGPLRYYIFDKPAPIGNYGMEVYDENGGLTFSVLKKPLRVRDILSAGFPFPPYDPAVGQGNYSENHTYDYGRKYAMIFGRHSGRAAWEPLNGPDQYGFAYHTQRAYSVGCRQIANGMGLSEVCHYRGTQQKSFKYGYAPHQEWERANIMVVDVTGY